MSDAKPQAYDTWRIVRASEKSTGWRGVSIFSGDVAVANLVGQLDDSEMKRARFLVDAANAHCELVAAARAALTVIEAAQRGEYLKPELIEPVAAQLAAAIALGGGE